jgi:hypothetical protein
MEENKMTEQNEEQKVYPTAEKQLMLAGVPFQVIKKEPRHNWMSNYAYYLHQKQNGGAIRPLLGRMSEKNEFQVYLNGEWVTKDLWKEYSYEEEVNGKKRKKLFFDHKYEYLMKFEIPIMVEFWDKEAKQRVTEQHEVVWGRLSKANHEKLLEQMNDPRSPDGSWFIIEHDEKKPLAERYKVKFHHL